MPSPGVFIWEKRVLIIKHLLCANLPAEDFTCNNHSNRQISSHYTDAETEAKRVRNSPGWEEYLDLDQGLPASRIWMKRGQPWSRESAGPWKQGAGPEDSAGHGQEAITAHPECHGGRHAVLLATEERMAFQEGRGRSGGGRREDVNQAPADTAQLLCCSKASQEGILAFPP